MAADDMCAECGRLREQARAAVLSADYSRLTDVRVLQRRHERDAQYVPTDQGDQAERQWQ